MQNEKGLTPGQRELEAALGQLRPSAVGIDSSEMMFDAGVAWARRRNRPWRLSCVTLAVILVAGIVIGPKRSAVPQNDYVTSEVQPVWQGEVSRPGRFASFDLQRLREPDSYIKLRTKVFEEGWDALGQGRRVGPSEPARTRMDLLETMLSS